MKKSTKKADAAKVEETARPKPYQTHGICSMLKDPEDGVKVRSVQIAVFSDESLQVEFSTQWEGEKEPRVTPLGLSPQAASLLFGTLWEMMHNRHKWVTPKPPIPEQNT